MRSQRSLDRSFLLPFLALAAPLAAQGVLVVGPAPGAGIDHTSLQAAIDASADGGVVRVLPGDYAVAAASFTLSGKSLTLIADSAGPVNFASGTSCTIQSTQPQHTVRMRGLPDNPGTVARISGCAGPVWLEECTLRAPYTPATAGLRVLTSPQVVLAECQIEGGVPTGLLLGVSCIEGDGALDVTASGVALYGCVLDGRPGSVGQLLMGLCGHSGGAAALGLQVGAFVSAFGSQIRGGDGGGCYWLSGNFVPKDAGAGVESEPGSTLVRLDCAIDAGTPIGGGPVIAPIVGYCGLVPPGEVIAFPGAARVFDASSPAAAGQSSTLTLFGVPGELAVAGLSATATALPLPALSGVLALGGPIGVVALGTVDASGVATKLLPLPPSVPAGTAIVTHVQGAVLDAQFAIRLATPSLLVTLGP